MVSFQCDACTDVVKKPKLDNHYGQCRSSFTCIDCSSTFAGPVEWKGHTSCITEAEKYQKSVYKGPKKGQSSRPGNGYQSHIQLKTMNATGKYHRSNSSQSSWSRPQYIRNCASGANSTPLGSPRRMSPADTSAVKPSPSVANAVTKTERGDVKKRDAEKHTLNGTEPKEKKRKKKHDAPREHDGKDASPSRDETNHEASKAKGSSEGHKRSEASGDDTQSKAQFATEGIPETSGDKKVKKRKKEEKGEKARLKQGDVSKETNTPPEKVAPSVDDGTKSEKKIKKRKHKEKKEADTETNHDSLAIETATRLEPLASQTDDVGGEKKKKKGKEEKAAGKKRKHEDPMANNVEKKRKQREQE